MYCGIPDPGLALFLAQGNSDAPVAPDEPESIQLLVTNALAILCLGVIALWS